MRASEIVRYRELQESITNARIEAGNIEFQARLRQAGVAGFEGLYALHAADEKKFARLYIAQAKAAHAMIKELMLAPEDEYFGAVTSKKGPGGFDVAERGINTPTIGRFLAESLIWVGEDIHSQRTTLTLAFQHPRGLSEKSPEMGSTECILRSELIELTYDRVQYRNEGDFARLGQRSETIAEVCRQTGIEPIAAESAHFTTAPA